MKGLEWKAPEADEHGVEAGDVVSLGGEEQVAYGRLWTLEAAELMEVQPGDDVEAAEAAADVARARPGDHVERVDAAEGGEQRGGAHRIAAERAGTLELASRHVEKVGHVSGSRQAR